MSAASKVAGRVNPAPGAARHGLILLAVAALLAFGALLSAACAARDLPLSSGHAPELDGGVGWLNSERPLRLKELKGKVVLLDFWTFCCINCMHVIPDLKRLEAKYPGELVVIGVHSAKFDNEKETANIREAILRYGVEHPVINDADFAIWRAYSVNAWPTLILIDPEGKVAGRYAGEGHYEELDSAIAALVDRFGKAGKLNRQPLNLRLEKSRVADRPLSFPGKIAGDPATGRLFIADSGHNRIVVANLSGKILDVIGSGKQGATDGSFARSCFHHPQGLALKDGKLYVADTENHTIRLVDFDTRTVKTVAGTGRQGEAPGGAGIALKTALSSPWDIVQAGDRLYIAMAGYHQLWVYDPAKNRIGPYAGSGQEDIVDGPLASAALAQPSGITTDGTRLYFADSEVSAVRSAGLGPGATVNTLVGRGLFAFGDVDGKLATARLQHPLGIFSFNGRLYVADSYNHKIKIVDPLTGTIRTFLGIGKAGLADGKPGRLAEPGGLTILNGNLYIADTNNHAVRVANILSGELKTLGLKGFPRAIPESKER
ncbi:MAG TPA: thioredoxin-like domain-containing protein [Candidatus Obscuribacterales bacterium]